MNGPTIVLSVADPGMDWGFPGAFGSGRGYRDGLGSTSDGAIAQDTSDVAGVAIAGVVEGSAADQAGLAVGDTITSLNGTAVTSADGLSSVIAASEVGAGMTIAWTDADGGEHTATVSLGAGPVG